MSFRGDRANVIHRSRSLSALGFNTDFLIRALVGCDELRVFTGCFGVVNPFNLEASPRKDSGYQYLVSRPLECEKIF